MTDPNRPIIAIDLGSVYIKTVLLDDASVPILSAITPSGFDHQATASRELSALLEAAGLKRPEVFLVTTGFARRSIPANLVVSEIGAHSWGCKHCGLLHSAPLTIVDIGGQDTKLIRLDATGRRTGFEINSVCAAGTGAFLDELARRLTISSDDFQALSAQTSQGCNCGSVCTVFAMTRILDLLQQGTPVDQIIVGAYQSVVDRILELGRLEQQVVLSGGVVAVHPRLAKLLAQSTGLPVCIAPDSQLRGAIGAALYAKHQLAQGTNRSS